MIEGLTLDCNHIRLLAIRLLQLLWFTIERCNIAEATWRTGCSPWGVASITQTVSGLHARRRVSVSSAPDFFWHRLLRPRPRILIAKSSPGSRRATTP